MRESPVAANATGACSVSPAAPPKAEHCASTEREADRDSATAHAEAGSRDPAGSLEQLVSRGSGSVAGGGGAQPAILRVLLTGAKKHWFIIGVALVVLLAAAEEFSGQVPLIICAAKPSLAAPFSLSNVPTGVFVPPEISVNYVAVAVIFVFSGLGLQTRVLADALLFWKMHLRAEFGALPAYSIRFWETAYPSRLQRGIGARSAYGNEPAALMNAVLGNIIGVFVSPTLIGAYTRGIAQGSSSVSYSDVFVNLGVTVIAPLVLGQLVQYFAPRFVVWLKRHVSFPDLSSVLLLLLVYSVFCNTFAENITATTPVADLIAVVFIDLAILVLFATLSFAISGLPIFGFTRSDKVAVVNCAATKTLALGIPIITAMFANSPLVGLYSIPLIVYHAEQIILGAFLVSVFQRWVRKGPPTPYFPDQIDEEFIVDSPARRMS
ncbi:MAG: SBF-like CPA transporter family-domain-containing protein [Olpidium bornovanus]|uniref:SBF-like CPA transporter family-domain-containing protein n=1 Tax=Olpidium bornovanus TaxID=278681 RepID=A0A8H7ZVF1_9FUNG|nr:MAG: SBF-like CPA transporter family-domain-containing protein [Olpidium bornovanus]